MFDVRHLKPIATPRPARRTPLGAARSILLALCLAAPALPAAGDTIVSQGRRFSRQDVTAIRGDRIILATQKYLPAAKVDHIEFDAFDVQPYSTGIVLKNGTRLGGAIREMRKEVVFRSVTLGDISLNRDDIAWVYYSTDAFAREVAADGTGTRLRTRSGADIRGRLLWADRASAGIMTDDGIRRVEADNILFVQLHPRPPDGPVALRNDDRLAGCRFDGVRIQVTVAGTEYAVPLAAARRIDFKQER